jgi:predicted phage terminase large subunit-like protein
VGERRFTRRPGEALHPEREPSEMLEQIRRTIGEYNFAGQYQQAPVPQGGGMVKAAWFGNYAPNERPDKFDRIVQSWDTANKATELSPHPNPPPHAGEGRMGAHDLGDQGQGPLFAACVAPAHGISRAQAGGARAVPGFWRQCGADRGQGLGHPLIQELVQDGLHAVTRYQPQSDKIMRMHAQTATIENGFVHLPKEAGWLAEYLHEMTAFPRGRHDDQVDSTAQLLDWFKQASSGPISNRGIWELTRQRAEELRRGQMPGPLVRLRAPRGVGAVQLLSGIRRNVAVDGTVEMSETDAEPLLRAGWVRVAAT